MVDLATELVLMSIHLYVLSVHRKSFTVCMKFGIQLEVDECYMTPITVVGLAYLGHNDNAD